MVSSLSRELSKIQNRLAKIYEDRLDGLITTELWEQMNKKIPAGAGGHQKEATGPPLGQRAVLRRWHQDSRTRPTCLYSFINPRILPNSGKSSILYI
jgi:hypothetical protein